MNGKSVIVGNENEMNDDLIKRLRGKTPNMVVGHAAMEEAADRIEALEAQLAPARADALREVRDSAVLPQFAGEGLNGFIDYMLNHPAPAPTPSLDDLAVAELEWAADEILRKCATTQKELDSQICAAAAIAAIIKTAGGKKE
jgi:hypothetical protein